MLKIGDKVRIRGVEGIHTVEANDSEHLPLRAGGEALTVYGQCYGDEAFTVVELVEEPFEFRVGDRVNIKGIEGIHELEESFQERYPLYASASDDVYTSQGYLYGELFTKEGKPYMFNEVHLTLVERPILNPARANERPEFELHDKVAFKGLESMGHFTLYPNDLDDSEDYPFKAINSNNVVFRVTRDSSDIVLIDRCVLSATTNEEVTEVQFETFTKVENILKEHATSKLKILLWEAIRERLSNKAEPLMQIGSENYERFRFSMSALPVKYQAIEGGKLPTYAHDGDAGMDLYVRDLEVIELEEGSIMKYYLGIKLDLDEGYAAFIFPRSSAYKTQHLMTNCVGVIDSGYKGEISAVMACRTPYKIGDRACQMVIRPVPKIRLIGVEGLRESQRGSNGYGSTGK